MKFWSRADDSGSKLSCLTALIPRAAIGATRCVVRLAAQPDPVAQGSSHLIASPARAGSGCAINSSVCFALLAALCFSSNAFSAHFELVYPRSSTSVATDSRDVFPHKLLKLALAKAGHTVTFSPSRDVMEAARVNVELRENRNINIVYTGMDPDLESSLRPIRIPIFRGLLGHRIFIINKNRQAAFSRVKTLDDLRKLVAGQGIGWQDVDILKAANLPVVTSKYDLLFKMVEAGRVDYFPRGANEPFGELAARAGKEANLVVEKNLVLVYPFDLFFYTCKENEALASAIETGLKAAYADGSYLELFNKDAGIQKALIEANLKGRAPIYIDNPLLSNESRNIRREYWMQQF